MKVRNRIVWLLLPVFILCAVLGANLPHSDAAAALQDIQSHWAKAQIEGLIGQGVVSGYPDGTFKPNNYVTRAEFVTMTNRAFKFTQQAALEFKDVKSSDWYYAEIAKAKAAGYISGYEDGTFKPGNQVSRQEAAVMLAQALNINGSNSLDKLNDYKDGSQIPSWSRNAIAGMIAAGYMSGYPDKTLKADQPITRAEAAAVFSKVMAGKSPSDGSKTTPSEIIDKPEAPKTSTSLRRGGGSGGSSDDSDDETKPTISTTAVKSAKEGIEIVVEAVISDDVKVEKAQLFYRTVGDASYTSLIMNEASGTYSATIPGSAVTPAGLEYYIEAQDDAGNVAKSGPYTVKVEAKAATLVSIEITKPANKLEYFEGEPLDITGLEVTGTYSDGKTQIEDITVDNINGFDSSKPVESQTLTITVGAITTTYTVQIKAGPEGELVSIEITKEANKLVYTVGDPLDITGLVVTGHYSDGINKVEKVTEDNISGFDSSEPVESQTLTITVGGKTATYTITIEEKPAVTPVSVIKEAIANFAPMTGSTTFTGSVAVPSLTNVAVQVDVAGTINSSQVQNSNLTVEIEIIGDGKPTVAAFPLAELFVGPDSAAESLVSQGTLGEDSSNYTITLTGVDCPQSLLDIMTEAGNINPSRATLTFAGQKLDCKIKISKASGRIISIDNIKLTGTINLKSSLVGNKTCTNNFEATTLTLTY